MLFSESKLTLFLHDERIFSPSLENRRQAANIYASLHE
jgi:hypothetical protein